ncbi:MAG: glycosyltransferase family 4 protein [Hyphomicrobiaceae bacterium]|nr:glycosyltransferase family 4 protein [Hyphomicrobiaceae bacterium]
MNKKSCKILFICTEDWFYYSHFRPLVKAAQKIKGAKVLLATSVGDKRRDLESCGLDVIPVDFDRASMGIFSALRLFWQLSRLLRSEKPDIVHFIALKPVLLGGLLRLVAPPTRVVYHVTGLGTLAEGDSGRKRILRRLVFRLPGYYLRSKKTMLFVENPDDADYLRKYGLSPDAPVTILGGAGVDPEKYCAQPIEEKDQLYVTFVGRMIRTKGVDVLVEAMALLAERLPNLHLQLYGVCDPANPGSYEEKTLREWGQRPNISWHGYSRDIVNICREADICVVPTRTREGMPRAMLEAASCARPLVVTNVPGCRHFVRDGVEGFVVPTQDAGALATALFELASDRALREKMGHAARQRVLEGFTESHVINEVAKAYRHML